VQKRANNCQPQPPLFAILGKSAYTGTRPTLCWPGHALARGWTWSSCLPSHPFADYLRQSNEGQTAAVVNEVITKPDISKVKMSALWPDTHPEVERLQIERLRQTPDWRKMALMAEMGQSVRTLALAGLRQRVTK